MSVTGHFIKVPKNIATGLNPDGSEIQAADVGYPAPPNERQLAARPAVRSRLRSPASTARSGCSSTGAT